MLQVEEEHASLVKTKSELKQTKSQLEGEVARGQQEREGGYFSVHVCVHMGERMASMVIRKTQRCAYHERCCFWFTFCSSEDESMAAGGALIGPRLFPLTAAIVSAQPF